jgi:anti-sigma B factor antagonist
MFSKSKHPVTHTVSTEGRITISNSNEMRRQLCTALRSRPVQVTVDLSKTTYIDTSGVATLMEAMRTARGQGTRLVLAGLHGQPQNLLELSDLKHLFEFAPQETRV